MHAVTLVYKYLYNFKFLYGNLLKASLHAFCSPSTQSHKQIGPRLCMPEYMIARIDVCVFVCSSELMSVRKQVLIQFTNQKISHPQTSLRGINFAYIRR